MKFTNQKLQFPPIIMWSMCGIFYCYQYFLQVSPSVIADDLMRDFGVTATALGTLASCYFYAFVAMQIPVGMLFDRFGARKLLTAAATVCALGSFLFGYSSSFMLAAIGRLLIGFAASFVTVGGMFIAANTLPLKRFAMLNGTILALGMLGAIGAGAPLAYLANTISWRSTMILFGAIGLLIAVAIFIIIRDLQQPTTTPKITTNFCSGLKYTLNNSQIWLAGICSGLMFMPISVFGSLWGVPFLMRRFVISNTCAASMLINFFIGLAIGTPFLGWLSDYCSRRKLIILVGAIGAGISVTSLLYLPGISKSIAAFLLFGFGFFNGGFMVTFSITREIDISGSPGTTSGFMNMLSMVGSALAPPLVGMLLDTKWNGSIVDGIHYYSLENFQFALMLLPLAFVAAILVLPFIRETYCKSCN